MATGGASVTYELNEVVRNNIGSPTSNSLLQIPTGAGILWAEAWPVHIQTTLGSPLGPFTFSIRRTLVTGTDDLFWFSYNSGTYVRNDEILVPTSGTPAMSTYPKRLLLPGDDIRYSQPINGIFEIGVRFWVLYAKSA